MNVDVALDKIDSQWLSNDTMKTVQEEVTTRAAISASLDSKRHPISEIDLSAVVHGGVASMALVMFGFYTKSAKYSAGSIALFVLSVGMFRDCDCRYSSECRAEQRRRIGNSQSGAANGTAGSSAPIFTNP